jgi:DNA gyrase inhibitor GyrI
MSLNENAEIITWSPIHYVFHEKIGPFQETAQKAWEALHAGVPEIEKQCKVTGYTSLYKIEPEMIYRAGVCVDRKPEVLPKGFRYEKFEGGKYSRFILTGPYAQLPEACGRVFEIIEDTHMQIREDAFYVENYVNSPATTPEEKLITEIMMPVE